MPDRRLLDTIALARHRDWGIWPISWLFPTHLKTLFVIDGSINLSTVGFGLGLVLDILRDTSLGWWVRFNVDVARRSPGTPSINPTPGPYEPKYDQFRFDMAGFNLADYHQVWFFGFNPGNDDGPDSNIGLATQVPLTNPELALLANWMDAGGGVFATGDHDYLGASMCSRIPRVRTMRRWTNAQGVPPIGGPTRIDTNQPATPQQAASTQFMPFNLQSDAVPQPVEIVWQSLGGWLPWVRSYAPHPILCTPAGVIDQFPDHPHEGEVIPDNDVQLNLPVNIPGYSGVEYPGLPGGARPGIIAFGRSTHVPTNRIKGVLNPKRFGLVGVYDGQAAGVGRVVVDSTWHHWFSENLIGFQASNPNVWLKMRHFFRNVGLWLATPAQRARMLKSATWGVVVGSGPMEFPPTASIWELGARAMDVIGRTASQCARREWVFDFFLLERIRKLPPFPDPCLTCPPWDLLERAVFGGVAKGLINVALEYQMLEAHGGRAIPDPDAIARGATAGLAIARKELVTALTAGGKQAITLGETLGKAARDLRFEAPDLGTRKVRLFVEAVQVLDPRDPALTGESADLALRVVADGHLVADRVVAEVRLPDPDRRGLVLRTPREPVAELVVWDGTTVEVTVAASADSSGAEPPAADLRGRATLTGHPDTWLGPQRARGAADDQWRLWLRVEPAEPRQRAATRGPAKKRGPVKRRPARKRR